MVIEHFHSGAAVEIYRRAQAEGRMLPGGLEYVSSWVDFHFETCFQLMRTDSESLFEEWIAKWKDLCDFEIIPVRTSAEASEVMAPRL